MCIRDSSLGEYSALVAAGALSFEDAVALVAKRGEFMETAAPAGSGKMVAVMNTDPSLIEEICQKASEKGVEMCIRDRYLTMVSSVT